MSRPDDNHLKECEDVNKGKHWNNFDCICNQLESVFDEKYICTECGWTHSEASCDRCGSIMKKKI